LGGLNAVGFLRLSHGRTVSAPGKL
jgi:hypothetical protein